MLAGRLSIRAINSSSVCSPPLILSPGGKMVARPLASVMRRRARADPRPRAGRKLERARDGKREEPMGRERPLAGAQNVGFPTAVQLRLSKSGEDSGLRSRRQGASVLHDARRRASGRRPAVTVPHATGWKALGNIKSSPLSMTSIDNHAIGHRPRLPRADLRLCEAWRRAPTSTMGRPARYRRAEQG